MDQSRVQHPSEAVRSYDQAGCFALLAPDTRDTSRDDPAWGGNSLPCVNREELGGLARGTWVR